MTEEPKFPKTRVSRGDRTPYVKMTIHWSRKNMRRAMALRRVRGKMIPVTQTWLKLGVGHLPPREYRRSIAPIPEYILGIDILSGLTLQTTVGEFRLRERCISTRAVQGIIRGRAKIEPVCLPQPRRITNTKQYRVRGGQEVTKTVQELERVGIIRPAHSPYNSPIWPIRKSDGT